MPQLVLGYWKIRGLAQPLRHLLSYTGLEFQQVQYDNREKWFQEDKVNLGLDFPNIPYLLDGDFKLTESIAIAKYIPHRSGHTDLLGKTAEDQGKVQNILGVFSDTFKEIPSLLWNKDYQTLKIQKLESVRAKLDYIKNFVGDKQFVLGYLTIVDFILAERLYVFEALYPHQKQNYKFWWRIRHNVEALPGVKAYYARPDALVGPFMPPTASLNISPVKPVKLGYWGIRGLAQIPRLLLGYSGVQFEDITYSQGQKWFKEDKLNLGLDFPNIPYLIDGDYNVTESTAVQRYIIRRWGKTELLGKNIHDNALVESFLSVFTEIAGDVRGLFFNKEYETAKVGVIEKYAAKLEQLNKFVGEKDFVLGYLTLADFVVAEESNYFARIFPNEYKTYGFLHRIRLNFQSLPEIKAYYQRPNAFKGRFFPPTAVISVEEPVAAEQTQA